MSNDLEVLGQAALILNTSIQEKGDQITALVAVIGSMLAVLQAKDVLTEGDVDTLFELVNRVCPNVDTKAVGDLLDVLHKQSKELRTVLVPTET